MIQSAKYYKPKEVALILNVSKDTIYREISDGKLPANLIRNRLRISEESLKTYLDRKATHQNREYISRTRRKKSTVDCMAKL